MGSYILIVPKIIFAYGKSLIYSLFNIRLSSYFLNLALFGAEFQNTNFYTIYIPISLQGSTITLFSFDSLYNTNLFPII